MLWDEISHCVRNDKVGAMCSYSTLSFLEISSNEWSRSHKPKILLTFARERNTIMEAEDKKLARSTTATGKKSKGFTAEERAAMKERARELKAEAEKADGESAVLAKIAEMPESDRVMAERIHAIIKANAPDLMPKTWYGMPAYARDGKVVCFFTSAHKFNSRYATFGFNDDAHLDDGTMWPTSFALTALTAADEARIGALVQQAVS